MFEIIRQETLKNHLLSKIPLLGVKNDKKWKNKKLNKKVKIHSLDTCV